MSDKPDNIARVLGGLGLLVTITGWFAASCNQRQLVEVQSQKGKELEEYKANLTIQIEEIKQGWQEDRELQKQLREEWASKPKLVVVNKGSWEPGDAYHLLIRSESTKPVRIISATYKYDRRRQRSPGERAMGAMPDNIYVEFVSKGHASERQEFSTLVDQVIMPDKPEATVIVGITIPERAGKDSYDGTLTLNYGDEQEARQLIVKSVRLDAMKSLDRKRGQ